MQPIETHSFPRSFGLCQSRCNLFCCCVASLPKIAIGIAAAILVVQCPNANAQGAQNIENTQTQADPNSADPSKSVDNTIRSETTASPSKTVSTNDSAGNFAAMTQHEATEAQGTKGPDTNANDTQVTDVQSDDELLRELTAAASTDDVERQKNAGSADVYWQREQQDPAGLLGKELIGNETNPALSLILDVGFAYFSSENRLRMGGHSPTTSGPVIQGGELAASASVDPYFRVDLAFSLNHGHIEEFFLTTTSLPWNLQLRAGQFGSNIGRHNPTHLHSWDFATHPLPNQFLFGTHGIALPGAELSYLFPLPWYMELTGAVQMGHSGSFRTKSGDNGSAGFEDFVYPVRLAQFLDVGDDWGLQLGLNGVFGTSAIGPENGNRTEAFGADLLLKWRPIGQGRTGFVYVKWTTEAWTRAMQVPNDLWRDVGGYTDLVFGLGQYWNTGVRGELWRELSGAAPTDQNTRAGFGVDMEQATAQVSYMPTHFSRIRAQYALQHSALFGFNHAAILQLEVSAGAHGAHQY